MTFLSLRIKSELKKLKSCSSFHKEYNLHENINVSFEFFDYKHLHHPTIDVLCHIKCEKKYPFHDILCLPKELSLEIYKYYEKEFIYITLRYKMRRDFPFQPPKIVLESLSSTFPKDNEKIKTFVMYIIKETNILYGVERMNRVKITYSPALTLDKKTICLLSRLQPLFEFYELVPLDIISNHDKNIERFQYISKLKSTEEINFCLLEEFDKEGDLKN